jgi:DNA-binding MurR/RpiR family transcriptional regulator
MAAARDVTSLIASRLDELSPNDRMIAEFLLADPAQASFESADSLARKVGVSKAAVVRFGARLGLGGFGGLREALVEAARARLDGGDPVGTGTLAEAPERDASRSLADRLRASATEDLVRAVEVTGPAAIERAAAILDSGEGWIHVFGQRKSAALAEYAYFLLNPMLPNVGRVESGESALADHLLDIGPEDRLVAFTFQRYAKLTSEVVDYFHERGAPVVLVTDSASAPGATSAEVLLLCPSDAGDRRLPTATSAVFMIELLALTLLERNPQTAGRRLDDAERVWDRFGTY